MRGVIVMLNPGSAHNALMVVAVALDRTAA
jgi:hypothetical protein